MSDFQTLLVISSPMGVPLYSARGLSQAISPIAAIGGGGGGNLIRRTINGASVDLTYSQFRKYESKITCSDQQAPALDGIWPGMEVTVECVAELTYLTLGGSPSRPVVSGSDHVVGDFTAYRPVLTMRVKDFSTQSDEWNAVVSWSLDLEEV